MSDIRSNAHAVHFRSCDALRGIGIGLVVLSHIVLVIPFLRPLLPFRLALGSWGVSAFFVLSGFLLGRPYVDALLRRSALPDWKRYARRRFLRIWPAYAAVVLFSMGKSIIHHGSSRIVLEDVATHLLMIHNFFPTFVAGANNIALWTMAVDSQFYVVLPIVAWLLYACSVRAIDRAFLAVIASAICASVAWRIVTAYTTPHTMELVLVIQRNLVGMGAGFATGAFLAYLNARSIRCSATVARTLVAVAAVATLLDFSLAALVPDSAALKELAMDLLGTTCVGALIYALPYCAWPRLDDVLDSRLVGAIAANAYAFYLVHVPIKQTIESILAARLVSPESASYGVLFSIGFCLCCAVAVPALHRFVEMPFLSMKERSRELLVSSSATL